MREFILVKLSFLLFLVNIFASNNVTSYLITLTLDDKNESLRFERFRIPVLYQINESVLIILNQNQIDALSQADITFRILDQDAGSNSYYLAHHKVDQELRSNVIGSLQDYDILKNIDENIFKDLTQRIPVSKLDMASRPFYTQVNMKGLIDNNIDSLITPVIDDIDRDSVEYFINSLQQFGTRFMLAPNRFEISDWIYDKFKQFGFTDVEFDSFTAHTIISYPFVDTDTLTIQRNVVATLQGSTNPEDVIIVCGHYDSFNNYESPFDTAPGADDNASGTAAVLEMARVFMKNNFVPKQTIKFVALGAEELMYFGEGLNAGSKHFAAQAFEAGMNINLVINHDMISFNPQSADSNLVYINRAFTSDPFAQLALKNLDLYTEVSGLTYEYFGSDLLPFHDLGYKGIYFEEYEFSPYYHSSEDILENYDTAYCTEVIKASCATLVECATIPAPVKDFTITDPGDGASLLLTWEGTTSSNFSHYNIHIGEQAGVYDRVIETTETSMLIGELSSRILYYIGISVVDLAGFESVIIEQSGFPLYFSFDQGILVIDETIDSDGSLMKPTDEEVDDFFDSILQYFQTTNFDIIDNEGIGVIDFSAYSTLIWHGNDYTHLETPGVIQDDLAKFLEAGGNLIYTGYMPCAVFQPESNYPAEFGPGDFVYDYLKIATVDKGFGTRFSGAMASTAGYQDIYVDTTKTKAQNNYHLWNIEAIWANEEGNEIYFYDSEFDSVTIQGSMIGDPVGVEYLGEDFKVVTLSFPLYYMEADQAEQLLEYILSEKFAEPMSLPTKSDIPKIFTLYQNYPNPFNPVTTIVFDQPRTEHVEIEVFNTLGQKVETLFDGTKSAGRHQVQFKADELSSGIYYYRISAGDYSDIRKMVLLR